MANNPAAQSGTSGAANTAARRQQLQQAATLMTKGANALISGKDDAFSPEAVMNAVVSQLPPEVQQAIQQAKATRDQFEKVYPKGQSGEREFSTAGAARVTLDLLDQYGGADVKKILAARTQALEVAAKLGLNVPTIEDLVNYDWSKIGETLENLDLASLVSVDGLLNSLQAELLKFLPPGLADNLKHLQTMLAEFGLPTNLSEAYKALTKKAEDIKKAAAGAAGGGGPKVVIVNGHSVARVGKTFLAHGGIPIAGPGTTTVFAENSPIWCATPTMVHTCPIPFSTPPAPDGPAWSSQGSPDIFAEKFPVCRHDLDAIDLPKCTKANLLLTEQLAKSAWEKIKEEIAKRKAREEAKKLGANVGAGGVGGGKTGPKGGKVSEANGDGKQGVKAGDGTTGSKKSGDPNKPEQTPPKQNRPPVAKFVIIDQQANREVSLGADVDDLIKGRTYEARSLSYDLDDTDTQTPLAGIVSHAWRGSFLTGSLNGTSVTFKAPEPASKVYTLYLTVEDDEGNKDTTSSDIITRDMYDCESAKRVKEAALSNIAQANMLDRPETVRTWQNWLNGHGKPIAYDVGWYRKHSAVLTAEQEIAQWVLKKAVSSTQDNVSSPFQFNWNGWDVNVNRDGLFTTDLGTAMGQHGMDFTASGLVEKSNGDVRIIGSIHFHAYDRFNWQSVDTKAFPSAVGVEIPFTDIIIPIDAFVLDTYWQVLEDCSHAYPFNQSVDYTLNVEITVKSGVTNIRLQ